VDEKYIGRLARIVDADDSNRRGKNSLFGSPHPEFPDQTKEIKGENNRGAIEMPSNWIGRQVGVSTV
jgi:hypothetical protein